MRRERVSMLSCTRYPCTYTSRRLCPMYILAAPESGSPAGINRSAQRGRETSQPTAPQRSTLTNSQPPLLNTTPRTEDVEQPPRHRRPRACPAHRRAPRHPAAHWTHRPCSCARTDDCYVLRRRQEEPRALPPFGYVLAPARLRLVCSFSI